LLKHVTCWLVLLLVSASGSARPRQAAAKPAPVQKVIIDTDIGDDIDDAFALALALRSPELQILGITTTFGDTAERAKLVDRFLAATGEANIPVAAGIPTPPKTAFTQRAYAEGGDHSKSISHPKAVDFLLSELRRYPGEITLIAIGPLGNVGAVIEKDPKTFLQLKRVVMMGGSIERGYDESPDSPSHTPDAEWNVVNSIPAAQKLFASGVPIFMMPLDATQLRLDEGKRAYLFGQGTAVTDQLTLLYQEWGRQTPILYDPMTIAFALSPGLCPVAAMHIQVDEKGFTRVTAGLPNASVCLHSDPEAFFDFYLGRVTRHQEPASRVH